MGSNLGYGMDLPGAYTADAPWNDSEYQPRIIEQEISLSLIDEKWDITIEYGFEPVLMEAYPTNWFITWAGRTRPVDWRRTGLTLDEIFELAEQAFMQNMGGEIVW